MFKIKNQQVIIIETDDVEFMFRETEDCYEAWGKSKNYGLWNHIEGYCKCNGTYESLEEFIWDIDFDDYVDDVLIMEERLEDDACKLGTLDYLIKVAKECELI